MKKILYALAAVPAAGAAIATHDSLPVPSPGALDAPSELIAAIAPDVYVGRDSLGRYLRVVDGDTVLASFLPEPNTARRLSEEDYARVAQRLGVEVAAMKAVVKIEAGHTGRGFNKDGTALINFDLGVFRRNAQRRGIALGKHQKEHPEVFAPPNISRYGTQQAAQHKRLEGAMAIDSLLAIESTFWGMFQIGGFNWKLSRAESPQDFMQKMEAGEPEQLELFANFLENTGLVKYMRTRNWAAFARGYNGPSYAARKYHTRLASEYARASKK